MPQTLRIPDSNKRSAYLREYVAQALRMPAPVLKAAPAVKRKLRTLGMRLKTVRRLCARRCGSYRRLLLYAEIRRWLGKNVLTM